MAPTNLLSIFRTLLARAEEEEPMLKTLPVAAARVVLSIERRSSLFSGVFTGVFFGEGLGEIETDSGLA
jgi:hypothetical protein